LTSECRHSPSRAPDEKVDIHAGTNFSWPIDPGGKPNALEHHHLYSMAIRALKVFGQECAEEISVLSKFMEALAWSLARANW
jgi:predicted alpha/beta-hydrolase family hydrolase